MSDESQPTPSLRLKPRMRADNPAAVVASPAPTMSPESDHTPDIFAPAPLPSVPPSTSQDSAAEASPVEPRAPEGLALRKRPSISVDSSSAPPPPPPPISAPVAASKPSIDEALEPSPEEEPSAADPAGPTSVAEPGDVSRLKLKPRSSTGDVPLPLPSVGNAGLPPPISLTPVRTAPPIPMNAPPLPGIGAPALPPLSALPPRTAATPPAMRPPNLPPSAHGKRSSRRPEHSTAFRTVLWVVGGLAVLGVFAGGFLGFRYLTDQEKAALPPEKSAVAPAKVQPKSDANSATKDSSAAATSPDTPAEAQSMAGKMVQKARAAVQSNDERVAGMDEAVPDSGSAAKDSGTVADAAPTTPTYVDVQRPTTVVLDQTAVRPQPSNAFKAFVVNMRVNGVFQGEPGRALINGKMYHVGEIVDPKLLIKFSDINADRKTLYFEDRGGAQMQRRY